MYLVYIAFNIRIIFFENNSHKYRLSMVGVFDIEFHGYLL